MSIPDVVIDDKNGLIDSSLKVDGEFSVVSGAGIDFIVNPPKPDIARKSPFIIYVESFYTFIPGTTIASVYKLNLLTINLGIKTKF